MATSSFNKIWIYVALIILSFVFGFFKIAPDKQSKIDNTITGRLYGIDTPEISKKSKIGQAYSNEAARELKSLIFGQAVDVTTTGDKTYNREVCLIKKDGVDINLEMVRRGYAWAYRQYLKRPYASEYIHAENEARYRRLGLWQQANPKPPWEFRRQSSK